MSAVDFSILELLLKAPSKDAVRDVCDGSHRGCNHRLTEDTATTLNISHTEAEQILFKNLTSAQQVQSLFPEPFHSSLKNLLTKILLESSQTWRSEALSDQISLPRLQSLDWRVDLVSGSESVNRMSTPTCFLTLQMEDGSQSTDLESVSTVTMELSRQTVDTMLDGLGRIRDQLSNI
ncbi:COMM domain-containing protein 9 isoform X2 [Gouania willdenowi]|uniref:COMM domain-containing protein 9 isoform X2 n=1 Tax=Gouania willdenowi TaxID=441366 RepID=UPI0010554C93|nr:COMM domain-containing protein 9 isoform X2 [Gouania willdenowi]